MRLSQTRKSPFENDLQRSYTVILASLQCHQRESFVAYIGPLHNTCTRHFRDAALLIGADLTQWPAIEHYMTQSVQLSLLSKFWLITCEKYNDDLMDAQFDFFAKTNKPTELFSQFIYRRLWPILASERECIRNILRASGTLPCRNPAQAAEALVTYITEIAFHVKMGPPNPAYLD